MMDLVHEFLRWGPYGLYATFVLMICAIPLGWLYAYVAFVGKRRDITQPDATRMKAAWGGALILALLMFAWRQIASDTTQHELDDFVHWMNTGYFPWFGRLSAPLLDYLSSYAAEGNNLLVRLIAACALVVVLPAVDRPRFVRRHGVILPGDSWLGHRHDLRLRFRRRRAERRAVVPTWLPLGGSDPPVFPLRAPAAPGRVSARHSRGKVADHGGARPGAAQGHARQGRLAIEDHGVQIAEVRGRAQQGHGASRPTHQVRAPHEQGQAADDTGHR